MGGGGGGGGGFVAPGSSFIIFRAKESEEYEPEKRKAEDMNIVKELCKITEDKYDSVKNVTRLGKKPEEKGKSSPMKVIFEDERPKVS